MATILHTLDRNVIPRWRDFASTLQLGELTEPSSRRVLIEQQPGNLQPLEEDWRNHGTLSFAADLISAALVSGVTEVARQAALFVLEVQGEQYSTHPLTRVARGLLDNAKRSREQIPIFEAYSPKQTRSMISFHRTSLRSYPRDGLLWVDLSLLYTLEGLPEKARRAMTVALSLEPNNRFVLRSAARMFIHLNEPDRAHQLLKRSPLAKHDPWIISAEIAVATASKSISFSIDNGLRVLAASSFLPSETTELSAAVATLEFRDGNTRKARKHMHSGLRMPNENSLAQVKWLARKLNVHSPILNVTEFKVDRSYEALTWEAYLNKEWTASAAYAVSWLRDQSFSSRAANVAAHISAALLEDYGAAETLVRFGLRANPHEHLLHHLMAFIYASTDQVEQATYHLAQIHGPMTNATEVAVIANHGLINFREHDEVAGRMLYEASVKRAHEVGDDCSAAAALTYWAREEVRARSNFATAVIDRASGAIKKLGDKVVEGFFILDRIKSQLAGA